MSRLPRAHETAPPRIGYDIAHGAAPTWHPLFINGKEFKMPAAQPAPAPIRKNGTAKPLPAPVTWRYTDWAMI